jgi:hypothetical protein
VLGRVAPKTLWKEERDTGRDDFICGDVCACMGKWGTWKEHHPERSVVRTMEPAWLVKL